MPYFVDTLKGNDMAKTYEIRPFSKKGSEYKFRLIIDGLAKSNCYKTMQEAQDHVAVLKLTKVLRDAKEIRHERN